MGSFLLRRTILLIPVLLGVSLVVFVALHMAPGNPAQLLLGPTATPAEIHRLSAEMGLNRPLYVQYWSWLVNVFQGNLGTSIQYHEAVSSLLIGKMTNTMLLAFAAFVVSTVAGILVGLVSGYWNNTVIDHFFNVLNFTALSVPVFWLAELFILAFGLHFKWFPIQGMMKAGTSGGPGQLLVHITLPALSLAAAPAAVIAQITRVAFIEELGKQYMVTARSKGLPVVKAALVHALRNAWIPIVTTLGLEINYLIGGDVLVENVFSWPGAGELLVKSVLSRDYPTILGATMAIAVIFVVVNLLVDGLYPILNPKVGTDV